MVYLAWSYGSWIYNFLRNQCLSPLKLSVQIPLRWGVLDTAICDKVCQWLAAGWWFSPGTLVSSTNKTEPLKNLQIKFIDEIIFEYYVFTGKVIESRVYRPKAAWFSVEERFNTEEKPTLCFGETSQVCNKLIYIIYNIRTFSENI